MRRLPLILGIVLLVALVGLVIWYTRYDLETTEIDGRPVTVRLDRWTGDVGVVGETDDQQIGVIPILGGDAEEVLRGLDKILGGDGEGDPQETRERFEQLTGEFLENVTNVRGVLRSYRDEASRALGSEGQRRRAPGDPI